MYNTFLSKIQTAGGSFSSNTIFIIIGILVFITVGFSYYYFYLKPYMQATYRATNDGVNHDTSGNGNGNGSTAELLFFYADWCPHCKTAKPIWEGLKKEYDDENINGYNMMFTDVNCSTESEQTSKLMDKYSVEGFPTIKLLKNGEVIEFDAKPTKDNLNQFLQTVLK